MTFPGTRGTASGSGSGGGRWRPPSSSRRPEAPRDSAAKFARPRDVSAPAPQGGVYGHGRGHGHGHTRGYAATGSDAEIDKARAAAIAKAPAQATYLALCPRPTEELVAAELQALPGVSDVEPGHGVVRFSGSREAMYRANLHLRCSSRVLLRLSDVPCGSAEELYEIATAIPWEQYLDPRGTLAVSAHGSGPGLSNSMYTAVRVKDAVVDRLRARFGVRPDVDVHTPAVRINVQLYAGPSATGRGQTPRVAIALDSSDQPLYQRGYRAAQSEAPIKETLAAAILRLAGYATPAVGTAPTTVVDLCCGSGTLLAEAGLIALGRAPGRRRRFGFMRWPDFDARLFQRLCAEADAAERPATAPFLYGSDVDAKAVSLAKKCLDQAGLLPFARLKRGDLREATPPSEAAAGQPGIVVVNPPYGQRLGNELELIELYRGLGDTLKRRFAGYTAYVYTASLPLARQIGLRPSARHLLYNGDLEGRLLRFDLY